MAETEVPSTGSGAPDLDVDYSDVTVGDQSLEEFTGDQVLNPSLPPGTQNVAQDIVPQTDEFIDPTVAETPLAQQSASVQGTAGQVDPADVGNITGVTYDATQGTAAQGAVTEESTVRGQMAGLMDDVDNGVAVWADAAMRTANEAMAARGITASSMAGAAISQAVLEAAMPIAQQDAATFSTMNLENLRNRQNTMLSNTAADNAAKQFNAASENDVNKFMVDIRDRLLRFNEEQANAMEIRNVNAQDAVNKFNTSLDAENNKFVTENKLLIAQSNTQWRRQINTANTAAQNAVTAQNVQQAYEISTQAMAELWQQQRDVFAWSNQVSENERDRAFSLVVHSMDRSEFLADSNKAANNQLWSSLGNAAVSIIGSLFS